MKKIFSLGLIATLFIVSFLPIHAEGSSASAAKSSLAVGETTSITVRNADSQAILQATVTSSGSVSASVSIVVVDGSETFTVTANSAGSGSITISGYGEDLEGNRITINQTLAFNVTEPSTGGGGSSGGNTGGSGSTSPTVDNTEEDKRNNQKTEAELAQEELERRQRTPLFTNIMLTSTSDKRNGEVVHEITTLEDTFEYEYTLPKNITSLSLDMTPLAEDVVLTYDREISFLDEEFSKDVTITAVQDDVSQTFTLKLTRPQLVTTSYQIDSVEYSVWDDEALDEWMMGLGFERQTYQDTNGSDSLVYVKDSTRLQLLVNDENQATWILLDENNAMIREVVLLIDAESKIWFVSEAPESYHSLTHKKAGYEDQTIVLNNTMTSLNSSFTFKSTIKGWATDEGVITYATDTSNHEEFIFVGEDNVVKSAYVSFDAVDAKYQIWAYTATGLAALIAASFVAYWYINRKRMDEVLTRRKNYTENV